MKFRIQQHHTCDSTNERAFAALAAVEARHGDVHVATAQTAGRGRLGRKWHSAPGEGLYLSVVLLPAGPFHSGLPLALTMAGGLAVLAATRALGVAGAGLKWPNDVLVRGAKLSGVLVESRGSDALRPSFVLGIGLNVAQTHFAPELLAERPVTSLRLAGGVADLERAQASMLRELGWRLDLALGAPEAPRGPRAIAAEYAQELGLLGQAVDFELARERGRGRLVRLELEHLELATDNGPRRLALAHLAALRPASEPLNSEP
jgi:BirA family biotin operon repressor/biotin-[acetyl-CoA-carboxylase] ligase